MFQDVEIKIKKRNKILFNQNSECLMPLRALFMDQSHKVQILWALDCARSTLAVFEEKYPKELILRRSLKLCREWSKGKIKMTKAKRAILDAHALAKEIDDVEYEALCHAIGQAGATVHVGDHALWFVSYELTSIVLSFDKIGYEKAVKEKIKVYINKMHYWSKHKDTMSEEWADFLKMDDRHHDEKVVNK